MRRQQAGAALDAAVRTHRVIVLQGLPRVGRSRLLSHWCGRRDDAQLIEQVSDSADGGAPIRVLDHMRATQVDAFVEHFRDLERRDEDVRFILAPIDLATTRQLQRTLTGSVDMVDLPPLQSADYVAERLEVHEPMSPSAEVIPQATATNIPVFNPDVHWLRGGLPQSLEAESDETSLAWRRATIRDLLAHDYSSLNLSAGLRLADLLRWVANKNGDELDEASCMFATRDELRSVLAVFDALGLTRRLSNYPEGGNVGLGKKPKLYIRDSGILNALLGIETVAQLRTPARVGPCWEAYAIESLILATGGKGSAQFYRVKDQEIDLVLDFRRRDGPLLAIECKFNPNAQAREGFHGGVKAIKATEGFVVHAGPTSVAGAEPPRLDLAAAIQRLERLSAELS